ncbi:uncharacterized protein LOC142638042 [Castanea sativa]|uniref:uncharacterized protein LOC142638042 n=1 Tax=Castanea sativa TaxID=21020 RepID=UPI003F64C3EA
MESLEKMGQPQLFLSLKRGLALSIQEVFATEKFVEDSRKRAGMEQELRQEAERSLDQALAEKGKLTSQLADLKRERDGDKASLKTMGSQVEGQRKLLRQKDDKLAQVQQARSDLEKELTRAKEEAHAHKHALEAAKKASYQEGVIKMQEELTEAFAALCREYCQQVWGEAMNAAGVPQVSELRKPENIWLPLDIQEIEDPSVPASPTLPPVVQELAPTPTEPEGSHKEKDKCDDAEKEEVPSVEPLIPSTEKGKQALSTFELELKSTEAGSSSLQDPPFLV